MLEKSELVADYQKWRKEAALSMVKSGKISMSLGAYIYGTGVADFEDIVLQHDMACFLTKLQ